MPQECLVARFVADRYACGIGQNVLHYIPLVHSCLPVPGIEIIRTTVRIVLSDPNMYCDEIPVQLQQLVMLDGPLSIAGRLPCVVVPKGLSPRYSETTSKVWFADWTPSLCLMRTVDNLLSTRALSGRGWLAKRTGNQKE